MLFRSALLAHLVLTSIRIWRFAPPVARSDRRYLALLGWNPGTEQEIFSLDELVQAFSLDRVQKAGAIFDLQKLDWLQGQWMRRIAPEDFAKRIQPLVSVVHPAAANDPLFLDRAKLIQERITFFHEAPEMMGYFYARPIVPDDVLFNPKQKVTKEDLPTILSLLTNALEPIAATDWNLTCIQTVLEAAIASSPFKKGQVLWPLRALLTGRAYSPGAYEVASLLPKEEVMGRLRK